MICLRSFLLPVLIAVTTSTSCRTEDPKATKTHSWAYNPSQGVQLMHSPSPAAISSAKAVFPSGLFAAPTEVLIEAGESLINDPVYRQLMPGFNPAHDSISPAVVLRPRELRPKAHLAKASKAQEYTLEVPSPTPTSMSLTHSLRNVVVIYRAYDLAGGPMHVGIIPTEQLRIKGHTLAFQTRQWGSYQAVKLVDETPLPKRVYTSTQLPIRAANGEVLIERAE